MPSNTILRSDSYKVSHYKQYPPGTTEVYSYLESRGGKFPSTVFFGLQYYLKKYLEGIRVTPTDIEHAEWLIKRHIPNSVPLFNRDGWYHIWSRHGGRLPVEIKAPPEGMVIPNGNVLLTVRNTDPEVPWLTNYVETVLMRLWYPIAVATLSWHCKASIKAFLEHSGSAAAQETLDFKLHDFGARGVSSAESAEIGGAAHLVNFKGSDTMEAIEFLFDYYHATATDADFPAFSVPAAEHSTIVSWGRDHETDAYRNMLRQYPNGIVSVVSDSYDIINACREIWGGTLHKEVQNRNGVLVVRPDSGDPIEMVPKVIEILADRFGSTENEKRFRVLPPYLRVLQGDGINYDSIFNILTELIRRGWSSENVVFGMGGGLLQQVNRDTQEMAMKCSHVTINGLPCDVWKQPKSDSRKNSKRGKLALIPGRSGFETVRLEPGQIREDDQLETVFLDGQVLKYYDLTTIRRNANSFLS